MGLSTARRAHYIAMRIVAAGIKRNGMQTSQFTCNELADMASEILRQDGSILSFTQAQADTETRWITSNYPAVKEWLE
jgi:enoyl-[acyl-carrier-protein] reductase (NADH)